MLESFLNFLRYEKRYSPHTVQSYRHDLEQFAGFLKENFEEETPSASYQMVRSWIVKLVEDKLDPLSVNRKIASLRSYYKFLMRQDSITRNPMMRIKVLKSAKKLPHFVKERDMNEVLDLPAWDSSHESLRDRLILELLYGTGMRLSELIQLKDSQINLHDLTIKVLGKRNKERVIPIASPLADIIREYRQAKKREVPPNGDGIFIVNDQGGKCYPMMVYRVVRKYLGEHTTVEKKSPHVLRHTYATHLLNKGAEINAVKDLLGHSSLAATQVYTHNTMEKLKKVFDQAHPKA